MPKRLEHGTPEGYDAGCTTDAECPATRIHGMSCLTAHIRYVTGDNRYLALHGRGYTSTQIARRLGFTPTLVQTPEPAQEDTMTTNDTPEREPAPKPAPPTPATVADQLAPKRSPKILFSELTAEQRRACRTWAQHTGLTTALRGTLNNTTVRQWISAGRPKPHPEQPAAEDAHPKPTPATASASIDAADLAPTRIEIDGKTHSPDTPISELIDQVRDRIDMPRPEWATVTTSEDVDTARKERDQAIAIAEQTGRQLSTALEERDRARATAMRLEQELAHTTATGIPNDPRVAELEAQIDDLSRRIELYAPAYRNAPAVARELERTRNELTTAHNALAVALAAWQQARAELEERTEIARRIRAAIRNGHITELLTSPDGAPQVTRAAHAAHKRTWWRNR